MAAKNPPPPQGRSNRSGTGPEAPPEMPAGAAAPPTKWGLPGLYLVLMLGLAGLTVYLGGTFGVLTFRPEFQDNALRLLGALFIIALFLERALEAFVGTWRQMGRQHLQSNLEYAKKRLALLRGSGAANAEITRGWEVLREGERKIQTYKVHTARMTFLFGIAGGVLISLAGIRTLGQLVVAPPDENLRVFFVFLDVFLTGGLIGGGSEGLHRLISVVTEFMDTSREKIKAQKPAEPPENG